MNPLSKMALRFRPCYAILVLLSVAACTVPSSGGFQSAGRQTDARLIDTVPFFPQEQYQCGPAAMASVLNYRGLAITPEEIAPEIYSKSARGTLNFDMIFFAQKKGFQARQYPGNIEDLKKNIDRLNPIIVLVDYGLLTYRKDHYMVVVGYDSDHIIVHSGRDRFKSIPIGDFLVPWKKTKFWALLVEKGEGRPK